MSTCCAYGTSFYFDNDPLSPWNFPLIADKLIPSDEHAPQRWLVRFTVRISRIRWSAEWNIVTRSCTDLHNVSLFDRTFQFFISDIYIHVCICTWNLDFIIQIKIERVKWYGKQSLFVIENKIRTRIEGIELRAKSNGKVRSKKKEKINKWKDNNS